MMIRLQKRSVNAIALLAVAVAAGCAGPQPLAVHYFGLSPLPASASAPAAGPRTAQAPLLIVIQDVRLPQYLDRPQIVARTTGNSLFWSDERRWSEPLREELRRLLAVNLGRLMPEASVVSAPHAVGDRPALRLEVEIRNFELGGDGRVVLDAQWWAAGTRGLSSFPANTVLLSGSAATATDGDALAAAMSRIFGDFSRRVAERLRGPDGAMR